MIYAGENAEVRGARRKVHWSLRTLRWRYILYNNGAEELYDQENDPREWINLADDPDYAAIKCEMAQKLKDAIRGRE